MTAKGEGEIMIAKGYSKSNRVVTDLQNTTVSPKKAAGLLEVHEATVRRYIKGGIIQAHQYIKGGWIQIPLGEIVKLKPSIREKIESGRY